MEKQVEEKGLQLDDLKVSNLPELQGWREKQEKLVADNPYVEIIDNKTYTAACQSRTALLKGRTSLEGQEKTIASKIAAFRKEIGNKTKELIDITFPHEEKQQAEVKRYETIKEAEKQEKERIERERVEKIKSKIELFESESYKIIQSTKLEDLSLSKSMLDAFVNVEFDYEEYDIMFEQAKDRVQASWDAKCADIQEKEEQRLENERLEKENAEAKRLSDLQALRLSEMLPYVAFGEAVDLTKLSMLHDYVYVEILASKKALFEADAKEKKEAQDRLDAKAEEEKEAIYEIRKKRLEEAGMLYSDEHDTLWLEEDAEYILLKEDVANYHPLDFESVFMEVKKIVQDAKDKIEKEKVFEIRKNRLLEIGFVMGKINDSLDNDVFIHENILLGTLKETILNYDAIDFETIITDAKLAIEKAKSDADEAEKQKAIDLQLAKEDAERLTKENKARVKRLAKDKLTLQNAIYVSLGLIPFESENQEIKDFITYASTKFEQLRDELLTELEKL